ncbi:hypothetical protein BO85DRAFT_83951 [Aspergillus piperis CBS 112811]|uniref:Uncharacterized protein n=1 Tax=Aspergillus piperis CBS 112811 TaxID=1448313 RepID=A0A8G1QYU5_9EURO|nr:hypothetical protein BO85DRAFT_83951 [Aspergillus piperis CBS 112811]RAH55377.1 hypothetical protein BO85DRAFT_83951 [Aspergillus piperis CBS 112811]
MTAYPSFSVVSRRPKFFFMGLVLSLIFLDPAQIRFFLCTSISLMVLAPELYRWEWHMTISNSSILVTYQRWSRCSVFFSNCLIVLISPRLISLWRFAYPVNSRGPDVECTRHHGDGARPGITLVTNDVSPFIIPIDLNGAL